MIEAIKDIDQQLFLFLNGLHHPMLDQAMYYMTKDVFWIPLYLFLLWMIYRAFGLKTAAWTLLGVVVVITLGDRISVELFKNVFQRYRPTHHLEIGDLVHTVNGYRGGKYGFVSSHAANSMAVATFLFYILRRPYPRWAPWIFAWAALFAYTRIYLGVHYPADIVCGGLLGFVIGYAVHVPFNRLVLSKT